MTDNRTTELTATDRLRELLDERGVEYTTNDGEHVKETCWPYMGELMAAFAEYDNGTTCFVCDTWCFTPEQAIAATLGSVPDEAELTQTYDAGFRNGVMAVFQQLEGIEDYEGLQDLIAEYWGEGEGNDER